MVDLPQSALPRQGLKSTELTTEDDWRRGQEGRESEDARSNMLRKRLGVRDEEVDAPQSRAGEDAANDETEYEDYEEEDGEKIRQFL